MSDAVIIALISAVAATLAALISLFNRQKLIEIHKDTNSRLDALILAHEKIAYELGFKQGIVVERERAQKEGEAR